MGELRWASPLIYRPSHTFQLPVRPQTHQTPLHFRCVCVSRPSSISAETNPIQEERKQSVAVFWDLDNKPPKSVRPYDAALRLRDMAAEFGNVVDMVAYANRHAFIYVPQWVRDERQERKRLDVMERQGLVEVEEPYLCEYCGRKCKTHIALKKHFKQLHERERNKRMTHLKHLKGKRRIKYKEKLADKEVKYKKVASEILVPKLGYGLGAELKRAGVFVRTVEDRPQAADEALMKHMNLYIARGLECLCLVSDDSDFINVLRLARMHRLLTIVVGETMRLRGYADMSFSWDDVASGRAQWQALEAYKQWYNKAALAKELLDDSDLEEGEGLDSVSVRPAVKISAFSEEEGGWKSEDEDSMLDGGASLDRVPSEVVDDALWDESDEWDGDSDDESEIDN